MFIVAQIFGLLDLVLTWISMQINDKKKIIFLMALVNIFSAICFILLGSISGALICGFAVLQVFINKICEEKFNKVPSWLIAIYIIISVLLGFISFNRYVDIIPIICSVLYSLTIIQGKEKNIRMLSLINILLWVAFDLVYGAYTTVISDFITVISTVVGIYRFDFRKSKEN